MNDRFLSEGRQKMDQVLALVKEDLSSVATGRAKPSMIEDIKVEAYAGSLMTIKELGNISAPDAHLITINPWDKGLTDKIAKAIATSDLNLNPVVDGEMIRISVPALTTERRETLVKAVKQKVESGKAMLRQARNDLKRDIDAQKDEAGVSEDDIFSANEELQKLIDQFNKTLDELEAAKAQELMTL